MMEKNKSHSHPQSSQNSSTQMMLKIYLSEHACSVSCLVDKEKVKSQLNKEGFIDIKLDLSDHIKVRITQDEYAKHAELFKNESFIKFFAPFYVVDNWDEENDSELTDTILRIKSLA